MPPKQKKGLKRDRSEDDLSSALSSPISSASVASGITYQTTGTTDAIVGDMRRLVHTTPPRVGPEMGARAAMYSTSPGIPLSQTYSVPSTPSSLSSEGEKKKVTKSKKKRRKAQNKKGGRKTNKRKSRKH
tara:strand:- start:1066 stop:1455 length:390 start_codon:yes stop_codon:yes gene_type:complete